MFKPGDYVRCIEAFISDTNIPFYAGAVYCVRAADEPPVKGETVSFPNVSNFIPWQPQPGDFVKRPDEDEEVRVDQVLEQHAEADDDTFWRIHGKNQHGADCSWLSFRPVLGKAPAKEWLNTNCEQPKSGWSQYAYACRGCGTIEKFQHEMIRFVCAKCSTETTISGGGRAEAPASQTQAAIFNLLPAAPEYIGASERQVAAMMARRKNVGEEQWPVSDEHGFTDLRARQQIQAVAAQNLASAQRRMAELQPKPRRKPWRPEQKRCGVWPYFEG